MDAADSNTQFLPESDDRLVSALFGLGYSQGYLEPTGCSSDPEDENCARAIKAFCRASRWEVTTHAGTSVRLELARQVDALQHKLRSLDCLSPTQPCTPGHYDAATHGAAALAEEKYGQQCREALQAKLAEFEILTRYTGFDEPNAEEWLNRYITASDFEALKHALIELQMLDSAEDTGDPHSQAMKDAAMACHHYFHEGLNESRCGICGPAMREFLGTQPPFTFDDVLHQELAAIHQARSEVGQHFGVTSSPRTHPRGRAHEARLMGLAFSGGGIRSATFNLGVLQALAREGLLRRFDYLSSVSGGGYISGWLHAWVKREASHEEPAGILKVESSLGRSAPSGSEHTDCANDAQPASRDGAPYHEPPPVAWLRRYSNYLTPKLGPLGADTLSAVATWLRNVLLNQLLLFLLAIPVLFVPWILTRYLDGIQAVSPKWYLATYILGCGMLVAAASLAALITGERNPWRAQRDGTRDDSSPTLLHRTFSRVTSKKRQRAMGLVQSSQVGAARVVVFTACLASLLIGLSITLTGAWNKSLYLFLTMFAAYALPAQLFFSFGADERNDSLAHTPSQAYRETQNRRRRQRIASGIAGGLLFALLMLVVNAKLPGDLSTAPGRYLNVIFAPPAIMACLLLAAALHIGVAGRSLRESSREWWSRVGGILLRTALLWLLLSAVALYAAYGVDSIRAAIYALGATWIATTLGGLFAGRSASDSGRWRRLLMHVAPYVFLAGLVILLSWGLHNVMVWGAGKLPGATSDETEQLQQTYCRKPTGSRPTEYSVTVTPDSHSSGETTLVQVAEPTSAVACDPQVYAKQADTALLLISDSLYKLLQEPLALPPGNAQRLLRFGVMLGLPMLFLGLAWLLGLSVDVNVFALHMFYRNRLERCYLGASNRERKEDPYTDLDPQDSPRLVELTLTDKACGQRPYPLINSALNLTRSDNLAWQERKAGSFVFTPQFCGYQLPGGGSGSKGAYQHTGEYVQDIGGWLSLSTPVTISGAAASPNAGYHTSAALAALMTVFDIRLGMWIQNPSQQAIWRQPGPKQSLRYLLNELTSSTNENSDFVYVSDGGHFENLALYELVRRRCRYIVVCDAGCDPDYSFEDLGNAIRKCKVDLGIDIEIDTRSIKPDPATGLSRSHCAVGTIHYERVDPTRAVAQGYLLYVKASLTGNEPADVGQYAAQHKAFPHESTGDQWYTESQFESYRALGLHAMSSLLADAISDEHRERHRRGFGIGERSYDRVDEIMYDILNPERPADSRPGKPRTARNLDREVLFKRLTERWYRPGDPIPRAEEHERTLQALLTRMADNPRLRFLDHQLFPEWSHLASHLPDDEADSTISMLPPNHRELRAGFYFCLQLMQLMDSIYRERNLEHTYNHPDNRGWMNLFRHWSGSGMFRATWAVNACNFSARLQQFCGRHIDLDVGRVQLGRRCSLVQVKTIDQLTPVERKQLVKISLKYDPEQSHELYVAPLEIRITDQQENAPDFHFPIGFVVFEGHFGVERKGIDTESEVETKRHLRYFRIRNHLRRMGLGRRGLECLWREDVELKVLPFEDINCIIEEADPQSLQRLWHSVLAAVPDQQIKQAHKLLDRIEVLGGGHQLHEIGETSLKKAMSDCLQKAENLLLEALNEQSDNDEAWRSLVRLYAYRGEYKKGCRILQQMIDRDPNCSLAYYNLAALTARSGECGKGNAAQRRKQAVETLNKALCIDNSLRHTAEEDEDFDPLRNRKDFKSLLESDC